MLSDVHRTDNCFSTNCFSIVPLSFALLLSTDPNFSLINFESRDSRFPTINGGRYNVFYMRQRKETRYLVTYDGQPSNVDTVKSVSIAFATSSKWKRCWHQFLSFMIGLFILPFSNSRYVPLKLIISNERYYWSRRIFLTIWLVGIVDVAVTGNWTTG